MSPRHDSTASRGTGNVASDVLRLRPGGTQYDRYSEALADLAAPSALHNLPTYRLLAAELHDAPRLIFGNGHYFDGVDTGEASAHEHAGVDLGELRTHTLRAAIGDPTDVTRKRTNVA